MYLKRDKELEILSHYLGDYSCQFYLRELSKMSGIPPMTVQHAVTNLEGDGILKSVMQGRNKYFALNLENAQTKLCLQQAEIHRTRSFLKKYPAFKTFLKELRGTQNPIIAFGSFAKFSAGIKDSDADLLIVVSEKNTHVKFPYHVLPHEVHEIRLSEDDFLKSLELSDALIGEIREHHVILNNHSFYVNAMWGHFTANKQQG